MPLIKDLSNSPQWFMDFFLESFSTVKGKEERFKENRIFLTKDVVSPKESFFGYGFLKESKLIFIGRRYAPQEEGEDVEYIKYITDF